MSIKQILDTVSDRRSHYRAGFGYGVSTAEEHVRRFLDESSEAALKRFRVSSVCRPGRYHMQPLSTVASSKGSQTVIVRSLATLK